MKDVFALPQRWDIWETPYLEVHYFLICGLEKKLYKQVQFPLKDIVCNDIAKRY